MKCLNFVTLFLFSLVLLPLASPTANAATVMLVKGKKVLLKVSRDESRSLKRGAKLKVVDENKKTRAIIMITKVKGSKAFAVLKKGRVKKNYIAMSPKGGKGKSAPKNQNLANKRENNKKDNADAIFKKWEYGVSAGFNLLTMNIDLGTEVVSATGTNFSVKGHLQYNMSPRISLAASMGYEGFSSSGTASTNLCDDNSSTACDTSIAYLATELWGKFYLSRGRLPFWIGGAGAFNFPLTKSSTALQEEDIGLTNLYIVGSGVELKMGNSTIPVWFEYAILPATETVEANYLSIKAGYNF
ncbi:MAG: hypothetical protein VX583_12785 [Bdellovibrionota bacterium]|nr:hypothetical protein [Pseudobdellovibrionaceae bacterium]|tara:strand:+ start:16854 stop:17753 length:900 start_codon:yes stop_codon:yes gene_type:complete